MQIILTNFLPFFYTMQPKNLLQTPPHSLRVILPPLFVIIPDILFQQVASSCQLLIRIELFHDKTLSKYYLFLFPESGDCSCLRVEVTRTEHDRQLFAVATPRMKQQNNGITDQEWEVTKYLYTFYF